MSKATTVGVSILCPSWLVDEIELQAREERRSRSAQIVLILERWAEEQARERAGERELAGVQS